MRPSSPLLDSVRDLFEGYDQLSKDFGVSFYGNARMMCDVTFNVIGHQRNASSNSGSGSNPSVDAPARQVYGVRAILAIRSRVFLEMLYGFSPPGTAAAAAFSSISATPGLTASGKPNRKFSKAALDKAPEKMSNRKRGSVTAETMHKLAQLPKLIQNNSEAKAIAKAKRKQSIASMPRTPTYLQVPGTSSTNQSTKDGSGFKAAFTRLVSGSWAGWGSKTRSDLALKRWQSESIYAKMDMGTGGDGNGVEVPGLSVCADVAKIDRNKLSQTEVRLKAEHLLIC